MRVIALDVGQDIRVAVSDAQASGLSLIRFGNAATARQFRFQPPSFPTELTKTSSPLGDPTLLLRSGY